jgi:hypothetical protein
VGIVSPFEDEFFVGPEASVKIGIQAHDPDGSVTRVEIFDRGVPIGFAKATTKDQYEFIYGNVEYGHHWVTAQATDNEGRTRLSGHVNFHINGQAQIKHIAPAADQVIKGPLNGLTVAVRVTNPSRAIKKVVIHLGLTLGGLPQDASPGPGENEYSTNFKEVSSGGTYTVYAEVIDDADVMTLSRPIHFRVTEPPEVKLNYDDGEYSRDLTSGTLLSSAGPTKLFAVVHRAEEYGENGKATSIVKVEFFADEKLICTDVNKDEEPGFRSFFHCRWFATPGKHRLSASATDRDGVVGKSPPVEIVVK